MSNPLEPATAEELVEAVRSAPRVLAIGAGTKLRLSTVGVETIRISTRKLRGIVEYDPTEFTFTARAGTPLREIAATLAEHGQYLPFDPPFAEAGATIGGTVGAGLSGPGRLRFGGLRDFILGVRFVDGEGQLLRLGGKVVKNAAGFDLPKFLVGSLGRFGALAEMTFKVFPRPAAQLTLKLQTKDVSAMTDILITAPNTRWELEALDASLADLVVYARLAGPAAALTALADEILKRWPGESLPATESAELWRAVAGFAWAYPDGPLIKVLVTPLQLPAFAEAMRELEGVRTWIGAAGNVAYVSLPTPAKPSFPWPALTLRGEAPLWPGLRAHFSIHQAVKAALDPHERFPPLVD